MHPSEAIKGVSSDKLEGRTIVIGIAGSIAAIESVKLIRELIRNGADVVPVMSMEAERIVHPNSIEFASGKKPIVELDGGVPYVDLCGAGPSAGALLIAPATANTISKIACGIADTAVTTFACSALGSGIPILIAPSMHESMYNQKILEENMKKLAKLGVTFIGPRIEENKAKMADLDETVSAVIRAVSDSDMEGKRVTVIAGSTEEEIDDVRVITNRSSGRMGVELARDAYERGAKVELWLGRAETDPPSFIKVKRFGTVTDLSRMVSKIRCDLCAVPAAISDFRPKKSGGKVSSKKGSLSIDLTPTPKIINLIRKKSKRIKIIGFKLESGLTKSELTTKALEKLKSAKLDLMVANDAKNIGKESGEIILLDKSGGSEDISGTKATLAHQIWSAAIHGI
ncbi:MAG: bifunctional phosphopantothenoylcysteine decarboxylase/phosphopantothenate--cysteine ligase CoaBC [Thermoplasmata archaeon]